MSARSHDFVPTTADPITGGPCRECQLGRWAPDHQTPGAGALFAALGRLDDDTTHGPTRIATARRYLAQALADIAAIGQAGRLDSVTWAAWTHKAFDTALAVLAGEVVDPPRLTIGDGLVALAPERPVEQLALVV